MNGSDVLLLVDGVVVGSQRGVTFDEATEEIDMSSKDGRAKRVIAGRYSSSITFDALYVPDDVSYQALKAAMRNGTLIQVNRQEEGALLESADAVVTAISEEGPDQDAATISVSLTIDGEWESGS
jgi:TP901-1 family phage major tail protein